MWDILDKQVQKELESFQSSYFQGCLAIPKSVPKPAICYEANILQMKYRVFSRVLGLMKHIHSQDGSGLAKQVLEEQLEKEWPGAAKVAVEIMQHLQVEGVFDPEVTKCKFKSIVKSACLTKNNESLAEDMKGYKKMKALRDEVVKGNKYFFKESLKNVRTLFRFRTELFEAKENFKNKLEYKKEKYLCDSCEKETDENTHVLFCESYRELREGKSLNNDEHLCKYLQKVLEIRTKLRLDR